MTDIIRSTALFEAQFNIAINLNVEPEIPIYPVRHIDLPVTLQILPIPILLRTAFIATLEKFLDGKIESFYDEDRALKTVLNFGNDYQALMTNWKYDTNDPDQVTIIAKLYESLPFDVKEKDQTWISRELAPTIIERVVANIPAVPPPKVYLRPPNRDIKILQRNNMAVTNASLVTLLSTGSSDPIRQSDPVLEEWYSYDVNQSELNINYADYREFVFFGSAVSRLDAFTNKLLAIESLEYLIAQNSSSLSTAGTGSVTASLSYPVMQQYSNDRINMIRSFDAYERFLYYDTGIPYSSSFSTDDREDAVYFNADCTWPKISGSVVSVAHAAFWLEIQRNELAQEYDNQNVHSLWNTLPMYLRDDEQSQEFITFVNMVGHQFDEMKGYIDQMGRVFDRSNSPTDGISPDLVWNLAESFGIKLPNQYAVKNLVDYTIGRDAQVTPAVYREFAVETWKRFLHNQIHIMKSKGTKTALRALVNTYGVLPTTLKIRESTTPGADDDAPLYELFEEQTNVLNCVLPSYVVIPWASSSLPNYTIETRFATTNNTATNVLVNADRWALVLQPTSNTHGKISLRNAVNVVMAETPPMDIFNGDFYSVMLRNNGTNMSLYAGRADTDQLLDDVKTTFIPVGLDFVSSSVINLGGSGSFFGQPFVGYIDEFRVWGEKISDDTYEEHVFYPGLYNGNTIRSARDKLWTRLSFSQTRNLGVVPLLDNESPFLRTVAAPSILRTFPAKNFPNQPQSPNSMEIIVRDVLRYMPNGGSNGYNSNNTVIAPPPHFSGSVWTDGVHTIPILRWDKSVVAQEIKQNQHQNTNIVGFYFNVTDAIDDSIVRTLGNLDIQDLIGDPRDQFKAHYSALQTINDLYWTSYAYKYNVNKFIDFVSNLLNPLFDQAKTLVPARAKLLAGIVHESPILERNKIQWKQAEATGLGTSRPNTNPTLFAVPLTSQPSVMGGEISNYFTQIDAIPAQLVVYGQSVALDTSLRAIGAESTVRATTITINQSNDRINYLQILLSRFGVHSVLELTDNQKGLMYQQLLVYQPPSTIQIGTGMNTDVGGILQPTIVGPYSDFRDLATTTYFTNPVGVVTVLTEQQVRAKQNILIPAGVWAATASYAANNYVIQVNQSGSAATGNGLEYYCTPSLAAGLFSSLIPPALDTDNWKRMQYIYVPVFITRIATKIAGSIELVDPSGGYPPFVGYDATHYRFRRDTRIGTLRKLWLGCKQTDATTPDGKPAVQITRSTGDVLVVATGAEPVQPPNDLSGPRLNVQ